MSCEVNTVVKENLYDEVGQMTVDEFLTNLEEKNVQGSNAIDNLMIDLVDKLFEERSI